MHNLAHYTGQQESMSVSGWRFVKMWFVYHIYGFLEIFWICFLNVVNVPAFVKVLVMVLRFYHSLR